LSDFNSTLRAEIFSAKRCFVGVDARPFAVAVMFGCAASFATPIGHQTNTYVFGAGGYRFSDFPKIGAPLNILLWIVVSTLIQIFWPFVPKPHLQR